MELPDEAHARLAPSQTCVSAVRCLPRRRVDSHAAASTAPRRCGVALTPSLRPSRPVAQRRDIRRVDSHGITTTPSTQLEVQTDLRRKPMSSNQGLHSGSLFEVRRFRLVAVAPRTLQPQSTDPAYLIFGPLEALAPIPSRAPKSASRVS